MAQELAAAGDPVSARRALDQVERQARSIPPGSMSAATLRRESARVAETMGDYPRAETLLLAASHDFLAIAPGYAAEAENALGSVELELSRPDRAVSAFERAVSLLDRLGVPAPKLLPALVNLTKAALSAGDIDRGAGAAARALQVAGRRSSSGPGREAGAGRGIPAPGRPSPGRSGPEGRIRPGHPGRHRGAGLVHGRERAL